MLRGTDEGGGALMEFIEIPFLPRSWWQIGSDGDLWYTHTSAYEIRRRTAGSEEVVFARAVEPIPVSEAQRAAILAEDERIEPDDLPRFKPATRGFFLDDEDRLWVVRSTQPGAVDVTADVFSADGRLLGTVTADLVLEPRPKVRNGVLVAVARDGLGIDRVVRYRIDLQQADRP